jgi:SAM-dependent methyltransferase
MKPFIRFNRFRAEGDFSYRHFWDFDDLLQKKLLVLLRKVAGPEEIAAACTRQWKRNMASLLRSAKEKIGKGNFEIGESQHSRERRLMIKRNTGHRPLVLYVGCGTGQDCLAWAREGMRVVGIDTNGALLAVARDWSNGLEYSASFAMMDMEHLGFGADTFDAFLFELYGSLPGESQIAALQKELARVLKKSGVGLIVADRKRYPSHWLLMGSRWPPSMTEWLKQQSALDFLFDERDACEERLQYGLYNRCHSEESLAAELSRTFDVLTCRYQEDPRYVLAEVRKKEGPMVLPWECSPRLDTCIIDLTPIADAVGKIESLCAELERHAAQVTAFFREGGKGSECLARFSPRTETFQAHLESVCGSAENNAIHDTKKSGRRGMSKPVHNFNERSDAFLFCGSSMGCLFRDGDRLVIGPCEIAEIRKGDVVVFTAPGDDKRIVHRVIAVGPDRFQTRGDSNPGADPWSLGRENLIGCVTAFERNGRLHSVTGGRRGRLRALLTGTIRRIDHHSSSVFHPIYRGLYRSCILRRLVPGSLSPRVILLRKDGSTEMQLLMGRKVVGRCLAEENEWKIRRPFRIFVDESTLPGF